MSLPAGVMDELELSQLIRGTSRQRLDDLNLLAQEFYI
jgi:hypothetical protein